jgi:hypothetical protein
MRHHLPTICVAAAASVLLAGCQLIVDDYYSDWTQLHLSVMIVDSPTPASQPQIAVSGTLHPGKDGRGRRRAIDDARLTVGTLVIPGERQRDDFYHYSHSWSPVAAATTDSVLTVVPPSVKGVQPQPPAVHLALWTRVTEPQPTIARGSDVVLEVRKLGGGSEQAGATNWTLNVHAGGQGFSMSGTGDPPTTLRIPAEHLPGAGTGPYSARLLLQRYAGGPPFGSGREQYDVMVNHTTEIAWTVRVAAP